MVRKQIERRWHTLHPSPRLAGRRIDTAVHRRLIGVKWAHMWEKADDNMITILDSRVDVALGIRIGHLYFAATNRWEDRTVGRRLIVVPYNVVLRIDIGKTRSHLRELCNTTFWILGSSISNTTLR